MEIPLRFDRCVASLLLANWKRVLRAWHRKWWASKENYFSRWFGRWKSRRCTNNISNSKKLQNTRWHSARLSRYLYKLLIFIGLNLSKFDITPSMLLSLDDPILPFPFLQACLNSYSGSRSFTDCQVNESELISPILASDETLKRFPKTKIFIASNDPLRDHSFKLHLRLL